EDGIRDRNVTGVQTCALPILTGETLKDFIEQHEAQKLRYLELYNQYLSRPPILDEPKKEEDWKPDNRLVGNFGKYLVDTFNGFRSEERRVGKECRARRWRTSQ